MQNVRARRGTRKTNNVFQKQSSRSHKKKEDNDLNKQKAVISLVLLLSTRGVGLTGEAHNNHVNALQQDWKSPISDAHAVGNILGFRVISQELVNA
jgi:hypothetical protein